MGTGINIARHLVGTLAFALMIAPTVAAAQSSFSAQNPSGIT
jgi:hypothetical protein